MQVKLVVWIPADHIAPIPWGDGGEFRFPRVRRLSLAPECEMALFGSYWQNQVFGGRTRETVAEIDEENVEIYNKRMVSTHRGERIRPGKVVVKQRDDQWDVRLENVNDDSEQQQDRSEQDSADSVQVCA